MWNTFFPFQEKMMTCRSIKEEKKEESIYNWMDNEASQLLCEPFFVLFWTPTTTILHGIKLIFLSRYLLNCYIWAWTDRKVKSITISILYFFSIINRHKLCITTPKKITTGCWTKLLNFHHQFSVTFEQKQK